MTQVREDVGTRAAHSATGRGYSRRTIRAGAALLAVAVLAALALLTPAVRLELRRSFTRLPAQYTEMYFPQDPVLERVSAGYLAVVPVSLVSHGTGAGQYTVDVSLTAGSGQVLDASTVTIQTRPDTPATTEIKLGPLTAQGPSASSVALSTSRSYVVLVTLAGHPQTLHYRLDIEQSS